MIGSSLARYEQHVAIAVSNVYDVVRAVEGTLHVCIWQLSLVVAINLIVDGTVGHELSLTYLIRIVLSTALELTVSQGRRHGSNSATASLLGVKAQM